ncbi:MAG: thiol:disulfide interchange protein DsbA/DsbL, partial [Gammaproteobacteria bacterium]
AGGPGGIEVIEVFWYGCPHCFSFDPVINGWEEELPADVSFVRLPVMWNPTNEIHARMYYTAEALGKLDQLHTAFFNALHRDGLSLTRENDIRKFFVQNGVSEADFDKAFRSFSVESKLKRARDLTQRYRIRSVPVIVVDGKYVVDGPEIKSFQDMLSVTDELVERERISL